MGRGLWFYKFKIRHCGRLYSVFEQSNYAGEGGTSPVPVHTAKAENIRTQRIDFIINLGGRNAQALCLGTFFSNPWINHEGQPAHIRFDAQGLARCCNASQVESSFPSFPDHARRGEGGKNRVF